MVQLASLRRHPRSLAGLAFGAWIVAMALAALFARASGPVWGFRLAEAPTGQLIGIDVDVNGVAWEEGFRSGDEIIHTSSGSPLLFLGREVVGPREITLRTAAGEVRSLQAPQASFGLQTLLIAAGVLFTVLGAAVYRWSADGLLGWVFLQFCASCATALVAAPSGASGHAWANYVVPVGALIASTSFFSIFLAFPRHMPHARRVFRASMLGALLLSGVAVTFTAASIEYPTALDALLSLWMAGHLGGGLILLAGRASRPENRRAMAPLLVGAGLGVTPVVALYALPSALGYNLVRPEMVAPALAAIPLSFAYAILRHRVFNLDALMRSVIIWGASVVATVCVYLVGWLLLQLTDMDPTERAIITAGAAASITPWLWSRLATLIDAWLYPAIHHARARQEAFKDAELDTQGAAFAQHVRSLVPAQWVLCLVLDDEVTDAGEPVWRRIGADGHLPEELAGAALVSPVYADLRTIERFAWINVRRTAASLAAIVAGPRLDGAPLDGIDREAIQVLAAGMAAPLEAAALRERAEDDAHFREGLTDLARELAAAAGVEDVLRITAQHTTSLLRAKAAGAWQPDRRDTSTHVLVASAGAEPSADILAGAARLASSLRRNGIQSARVTTPGGDHLLAYVLGEPGQTEVLYVASRDHSARPFGARYERHALEIAGHAAGALGRAAEREAFEDELRHKAFYDPLTELPNRALFLDRLEHALARIEREGEQVSVLFVDLDRFKVVNDSLGHAAGDGLLVEVGRRLKICLRGSDTVARLGGDEFTVLLDGPRSLAAATATAERILAVMREPFIVEGQPAYVSASIGIAGSMAGDRSPGDLLREADIALYRAKAAGRSRYAVFDADMNELPVAHLQLESDLHQALERKELRVHYQPILSLADGTITGVEALVRWEHPDRGLMPPGLFIPLAEETGLIAPIGQWVLEESCRQVREWQDRYQFDPPLSASVNLSARQLHDPDFVAQIGQAAVNAGLDPRLLELEVTESVVMQDAESSSAKLGQLKALGIRLAIDDFGTGYSSLSYLKRFPVDTLKIDRSFVSGVARDPQDAAIVRSIVALAKALDLTVTAEGIETTAQHGELRDMGCDHGQGYLLSKPLPPHLLESMFEGQRPRRLAA